MEEINLKELYSYFKSKILWIVIIIVTTLIVGNVYTILKRVPMYQSNTTIVLVGESKDGYNQSDSQLNQNLIGTYSEIIKSRKVLSQVIKNLDLKMNVAELSKNIVTTSVEDTEIIKITVSNEKAKITKKITDEIADVFSKEIQEIYNLENVAIIDKAEVAKEPYNVKYWSLGNEFGLGHMEGPNTPEEYTAKALLCARAMKEADPEIILFASGAYSPEHDMEPWFQKSLPLLAPEIDYISYHNYQPRIFEDGMDFTTLGGMRKNWNEVCQAPNKCFQNLSYVREKLDAGTDAMKKIKIAFDEWNLYFAWYHDPCTLEGIYTALMLEMFCQKQQELNMPIAMYFQPVNEGAINVYQENASLTSNGQVFRLMKKHQGNKLWQVDINNES